MRLFKEINTNRKFFYILILFVLFVFLIVSSVIFSKTSFAEERYTRSSFRHWVDYDKDCQLTRAEVLIRYNLGVLEFKTENKCMVISGTWWCPYTGLILYRASDLDIDHIIPLRWAWTHGAAGWSKQKKKQFANDPENLLAVQARANRQKGAKGLNKWLPENIEYRTAYVDKWLYLIDKYKLRMQPPQKLSPEQPVFPENYPNHPPVLSSHSPDFVH